MMKEKMVMVVCLVSCAVGAMTIKRSARGEAMYDNMARRAKRVSKVKSPSYS
jgi:hypothetical protein